MSKKWEKSVFYQDAKRSGRPKKLDNHQLKELQIFFNDDRSSSASSIKKNWERTFKIPISVRTIQRLRKKFGYRLKYPRTRPILSQINISKRLSYARKYSRERWDNHVFIDESDFQLYPQRKSLWLKRRERLFFHRPRHSPKVKILCGISIHGQIFLRMYTQTMNSSRFKKLLLDVKRNVKNHFSNPIVVMDNTPCHVMSPNKKFSFKAFSCSTFTPSIT